MLIDDVCTDMTARVLRQAPLFLSRERELAQLSRLLARSNQQRCVLLTGEPGVGKSALIEGLAYKLRTGTDAELRNLRILQLDLNGLVSGTVYRGQLEERVCRFLREATSDPDLVIFIDEFHTIDKAGGPECSIAECLKPPLARGDIAVIAATTTQEYRKLLERDPALVRRFVQIELAEPTRDVTVAMMRQVAQHLSADTGLMCNDLVLETIVDLTARYVRGRRFPDKALSALRQVFADKAAIRVADGPRMSLADLLDFVRFQTRLLREMSYDEAYRSLDNLLGCQSSSGDRSVTVEDVKNSLATLCKVPLDEMGGEGFDRKILGLSAVLRSLVVAQDRAVESVSSCLKRMAVGLRRPGAPIGSFVFAGPTGVGKTELAKSLAKVFWGSEDRMIRFDMSEYMEEHSVSKLIGSPPGYVGHEESGSLTRAVADNPYAVLLFDEVEKAHPKVANLLLQILDDGRLTDAKGETAEFTDTFIIMTSNVGSSELAALGRNEIESRHDEVTKRVRAMLCAAFSPELVNRVDEVVVFSPFRQEDLLSIVRLVSSTYNAGIMEQRQIGLCFTENAYSHIVAACYDPHMGARPLRRGLENLVYAPLSDNILRGEFAAGDTVIVDAGPQGVEFRKAAL